MKNKELKNRVLAFNHQRAIETEKAADMDIIISEIMKLPYGQLKKVLTNEVMAILEKYGYSE
jgi:hypothetical protein